MKELFKGGGWQIVEEEVSLPDGRTKKVRRVKRADSVHVIAIPKPGHILVLHEYRPFYQTKIWMLPSGRVDKEIDIEKAAQRELQEETGFRAEKLTYLFCTNHSESLMMTNHVFLATDLSPDPLPQDADEMIEVHELPIEEALKNILSSPKVHTASAYALLRYLYENKK
jgi:ADP-ribose pyrophosphatase